MANIYNDQTFLIPHLKKSDIKLYKALSGINSGLVAASNALPNLQSSILQTSQLPTSGTDGQIVNNNGVLYYWNTTTLSWIALTFTPKTNQVTATYALTTLAFNFATYNAPVAGLFMLYGTFKLLIDVLDSAQTITCNLVGGSSSILTGTWNQALTSGAQTTISLAAPYKANAGDLLALQIYKAGGSGTTSVQGTLNTVQIA